ncbi:MAG: gas vesicle protein K [Actinomycetota bacterium]|nr:gas vesicle protein K [Actinomycetota bacterium]
MRPAETPTGRRTGQQGLDGPLRPRLEGSGEDVGRSLGRLVVTLLDVVRQVVERQALRRVDAGDLTEQQVEDLGRALIGLEDTFDELRDTFGVREEDLFLPLDARRLLDAETPDHRRHRCADVTRAHSDRRETT